MKNLDLNLNITLPSGQKISLLNHTLPLSSLEAYAVEAISAACGGKLTIDVDASIAES